MTEFKVVKGEETIGSLAYTRDNDGQVKKTTTLPGPTTIEDAYDENNRLIEDNKQAYEYDKANNPTKVEGTGTYTYNEADELKEGPTATYTYNEDGQRTESKPKNGEPATKYTYNQAGNLTAVERAKGTKEPEIKDTYTYDGTNLRQSQTINGTKANLTWDTAEELPIILEDETYSYTYGPENLAIEQLTSAGATQWLHHDQQGSTRAITSGTGEVVGTSTYNPYGTLNSSSGTVTTPLGYDGQYTNSDTGLIYLRARTYDPQTAQFLSVDPALETTGEPYTYAEDNPVNATDPSGELAVVPYQDPPLPPPVVTDFPGPPLPPITIPSAPSVLTELVVRISSPPPPGVVSDLHLRIPIPARPRMPYGSVRSIAESVAVHMPPADDLFTYDPNWTVRYQFDSSPSERTGWRLGFGLYPNFDYRSGSAYGVLYWYYGPFSPSVFPLNPNEPPYPNLPPPR